MHRIDGPNATTDSRFTDGDPTAGTPATVVTDDWLNAVQEELASVIVTGAGLTLAKADNTQLLAAIRKIAYGFVPVGTVMWGYWQAAPSGFLLLNGSVVSRSTYSALWSWVSSQGLVVSEAAWAGGSQGMFSSGDGATNFRLADLRSEYTRGADFGRGGGGAAVGVRQADDIRAHDHVSGVRLEYSGAAVYGVTPVASGGRVDVTDGTTASAAITSSTGGAETRPRSVSLAAVVRY